MTNGQGHLDQRPGVRTALGLIAVQQTRRQLPALHRGQFPGQVQGIADTAIHALAGKWWREMRRIAGQQHTTLAPAFGQAGMEGVDHLTHDGNSAVSRTDAGNQLTRHGLGLQCFITLARQQHEFIAPRAMRPWQRNRRTRRIAIDPGMAESIGRTGQVHDQPLFGKGAAGHGNAQLFTHPAASAVAADQPVGADRIPLAIVCTPVVCTPVALAQLHRD